MDYPEFLILRLREPGDSLLCDREKMPFFLRILPRKVRNHLAPGWMRWKLPLECKETECIGSRGQEVWLPFEKSDLDNYSREEITDMLHRIIVEKGVQNMVVDEALEPFLEKGLRIDGGMIPYLMLDEIVKHVCKKHQIARRELRPVIMAASARETFAALKKLGTDLNRLTIVTDTPEEYEEFARDAFEEQGLLVRVVERPLERELYGNLFLELSPRFRGDCKWYPDGSVAVNLSGNPYQIRDILLQRRNLVCYNRFDISVQGCVLDNRVLQAVIYKTNTQIGMGQVEKVDKIREIYGFKVEKAGIKY